MQKAESVAFPQRFDKRIPEALTMSRDPFSNSYSRLRKESMQKATNGPAPQPTRTQKFLEYILFAVFGSTIALAAVAIYATSRPEHQRVPNLVASGVESNRVNVLMIGTTTRKGDSGADVVAIESLTMLSVQPTSGRAVLISIPRDLWIRVGRYGTRPLHAAHMVGDASGYPGAGVGLTIDTVQSVLGQPVHAFARYDLRDLQKTVDAMEGIDVDVQRGVFEYRAKLRFNRGKHHLNGLKAVKYAHSPYVAGQARDRFARESRQQQVLAAVLDKAIREGELEQLGSSFGPKTATNLDRDDIGLLSDALRRGGSPQTVTFEPYMNVIDVTSVAYKGKAVTPREGDFGSLQRVAGSVFARM
jgi:polyisoprenyl-teichoic acid--peptidoglycan teichoic acid transferase